MKKDKKELVLRSFSEGGKKIDDGYGDDLMSWVARFLVANDGRVPAPAELMTFIKSQKAS